MRCIFYNYQGPDAGPCYECFMKIISLLILLFSFSINPLFAEDISLTDYKASGHSKKLVKDKRKYSISKITQNLVELGLDEIKFSIDFYEPKTKILNALIILSPTINGEGFVEKSTAKFLVKNGFHVIVSEFRNLNNLNPIYDYTKEDEVIRAYEKGFFRPIAGVRLTLNYLREEYKFDKVFAVGGSQGGIRSISLLGSIPEIRAAWTNVAGGDFPSLYAYSEVKQLVKDRAVHMKALGLTKKSDYEAYMRSKLKNDPMRACLKRKADLRMLISLSDTSVPTSNQLKLWRACGSPEKREIKGGHVSGVLKLISERKKMLKFFKSYL